MQVVCWNINSIKIRLNYLINIIKDKKPDVILLQEIKCIENNLPFLELEELGYNITVVGQKTFNGVAILSKTPIEDIVKILPGDESDPQARYVECFTSINGIGYRLISVYVPNGQEVGSDKFQYKMRFFERLYNRLNELLTYDEKLIIGGDFNVAPEEIDVYNPKALEGTVGFHIDERKHFRKLLSLDLVDSFRLCHPNKQEFSWWDYRSGGWQYNRGMRIDQILVSPQVVDSLKNSGVYSEIRALEKTSDHAPIFIQLD
jgi:exodeoxyribonuclease-3